MPRGPLHARRAGPERRRADRPKAGDQRPCPFCRVAVMVFDERYPLDGAGAPAWACEDPQCGYRTPVRPDAFARPVPSKSLVRSAKELQAAARRTAMKGRTRKIQSRMTINRTAELIDKSKREDDRSRRQPLASGDSPLWIDTDSTGKIIGWSADGAALTGYSDRSLGGRLLPVMFVEDRPTSRQFEHAMIGIPVERIARFRPRERRAVPVVYRIALSPRSTDRDPVLRWTFERV